jgi:hypothetical protein
MTVNTSNNFIQLTNENFIWKMMGFDSFKRFDSIPDVDISMSCNVPQF